MADTPSIPPIPPPDPEPPAAVAEARPRTNTYTTPKSPEYKPDYGLFVGLFFGFVGGFFFVLQSNGVEVSWIWSAVIYVVCALGVAWTTLRHALPGKNKTTQFVVTFVLLAICLGLASVGTVKQYHKEHPKVETKPQAAPDTGKQNPAVLQDLGRKPRNSDHPHTPCTLKGGTYYANARDMPGGAKLDRPIFELEMPVPFTVWYGETDKYLLFFELALTNRGEDSIVKDWELCLEQDHKPTIYHPAAIPSPGLNLQNGETISSRTLLTETAVVNSIPHGHRSVGWVAFAIPKDVAEACIKSKQLPPGSIRFKDYLAHTYSYNFTPSGSIGDIYTYVPGKGTTPQ